MFLLFIIFFHAGAIFACTGGEKAPIQDGRMVVGTVNIAIVFAFHPAMRYFDFREGRFIAMIPESPITGGFPEWEKSQDIREEIGLLEYSIRTQVEKINSVLSAGFNEVATAAKKLAQKTVEQEKQILVTMSNKQKTLLKNLGAKIFGEFSSGAYGDAPKDQLERIMGEINWAVQTAAKTNGAAFILNSTQFFLPTTKVAENSMKIAASTPAPPADILKQWRINNLSDLEAIVQQASRSSPLPFGKPLPKQDGSKFCGGHFESVTDPEMLKTLSREFLDNRLAFLKPFEPLGVNRSVWRGVMEITEKEMTIEVLGNLFKIYKTRKLEQDAAFAVIQERFGVSAQ